MESKMEVDADESSKGIKSSHEEMLQEEAIPGPSSACAEEEKKDESQVEIIYVSSVKWCIRIYTNYALEVHL